MNMSIENIVCAHGVYLNNVFEQLTLALACSASECDVTWRTVRVECYCLPAATINAISHVTFLVFDFSVVVYVRLLFQLQGQYCFSLMTKQ